MEKGNKVLLVLLILLIIPISYAYEDLEIHSNLKSANISVDDGLDINLSIKDNNKGVDVPLFLEFLVEDKDGYILIKDLKTLILNTNAGVFKKIYLFPSTKPGDYKLITNVYYENKTYTTSNSFSINNEKIQKNQWLDNSNLIIAIPALLIITLLLVISTLLILIYIEKITLKRIHAKTKLKGVKKPVKAKLKKSPKLVKHETDIGKELGKQMGLLNQAYKLKIISEDTYKKEKKKIRGYIKRLK